MSREQRLDNITRMTYEDLKKFDDCADYICSFCSPTETMCENCELCSLMSDINYEFCINRREKR